MTCATRPATPRGTRDRCAPDWSLAASGPSTCAARAVTGWSCGAGRKEAGYALDAGIDGDDVEWRKDAIRQADAPHYTGGAALGIGWAQLTVGGRSHHVETPAGDSLAAFEVELAIGPDELYASFHDNQERTIAPYYVTIRPA